MRIERFQVGPLENNLYLLTAENSHDAIVVDPSLESESVLAEILRRGLSVKRILLTHAHFDHIAMVKPFHDETKAPVYLHPNDREFYDRGEEQAGAWGFAWPGSVPVTNWIGEEEEVGIPGIEARAILTPGHSPGSVTFVTPEGLIVGDVLFRGSVGRTDLPGGDTDALRASIRDQLYALADETVVYAGHGPATTIGAEARANPFVRRR